MKTIKILYQNRMYDLALKKVVHILNILENKPPKDFEEKEVIELMKKYKLFDCIFLNNINKI